MERLLAKMVANVMCYHKNFDVKDVRTWEYSRLLAYCHPSDREQFTSEYKQLQLEQQ
jgi:hypothetical protein